MSRSVINNLSGASIFQRVVTPEKNEAVKSAVTDNKIFIRENDEVFMAYENIIRCSNLRTSSSTYKTLDAPDLNFNILCLIPNTAGTLLAVLGEDKLVVVTLPSAGFMGSSSDQKLKVKSYVVANSILSKEFENHKILDLSWNRLAMYDSELVIMTSDNYIRSYDLNLSSDIPHFKKNLSASNSRALGLDMGTIVDPKSFCFGSSDQANPSACLAVYIFNSDGDIYSLYPVVPNVLSVTRTFVTTLFDQTTLLLQNTSGETKRAQLVQQLRFASFLYTHIGDVSKEIKATTKGVAEEFYSIAVGEAFKNPKLQGPFSLAPFPELLYTFEGIQIRSINCGSISILATLWSNGSSLLLLQDKSLIMSWENQSKLDMDNETEHEELLCGLTTLEYIQLSAQPFKSAKFADVTSSSIRYAYFVVINDCELVKVDFSEWGMHLSSAIQSGDASIFSSIMDDAASEVMLVSTGASHKGLALIGIDQSMYAVRLEADTVDIFCIPRANREDSQSQSGNIELKSTKEVKVTNREQKNPYSCRISGPATEILDMLNSYKKGDPSPASLNINLSQKISDNDETSLVSLSKVLEQMVNNKVSYLNFIGFQLHYRLCQQQKELEEQINSLNNTFTQEKVDERLSQVEAAFTRVDAAYNNQARLAERLTALIETLESAIEKNINNKNIVISSEEKQWFSEIEKQSTTLKKLRERIKDYDQLLNYIRSYVHTSGVKSAKHLSTNLPPNLQRRISVEKSQLDSVGKALGVQILAAENVLSEI